MHLPSSGEPFLDRYRDIFCGKFADDALRGAVFVDPLAERPYFFHIALTNARRRSDASFPEAFAQDAVLEQRLVGLRHEPGKAVEQAPVELLMVLQDGKPEASLAGVVVKTAESHAIVESFLTEHIVRPMAKKHRDDLLASIPEREDFIKRGFDYEESDLAAARTELRKRANAGDRKAAIELSKVKARQQQPGARRQRALAILQREPELIEPGHVEIVARALIVPSSDPVVLERHNREIELIAMYHARLHEESQGATVEDVSDPLLKRGHDLLSRRPNGDELAIEVKGRRGVGDVELTQNEWAKATNLREKYWLYFRLRLRHRHAASVASVRSVRRAVGESEGRRHHR